MSSLPIGLIIDFVAVLCALFAFWRGGRPERIAAVIVIANIVVGDVGRVLLPDSIALLRLVNDGLTATALLVVTVFYGALWMGGVMLFYAAQFAMHSYYIVTERPTRDYLYALINNVNFLGVIMCLVIGAAVSRRRVVRR